MNGNEITQLNKTLLFAFQAIRKLKEGPSIMKDGYSYVRLFEGEIPPSYYNDLFNADEALLTEHLPQLAIEYELKILEQRREEAQRRLDALKRG